MAQSSSSAGELQLLQQFQRDINRMSDADRVTRKRGLQKLLDDLPWSSNKHRNTLANLLLGHILLPLISGLADPVEKCRELSILLLSSSLTTMRSDTLNFEMTMRIIRGVCDRLNDIPCKETSEELRLQLLDLLKSIMKHQTFISSSSSEHSEAADGILTTMSKELLDTFPAAKRACAEIVCSVAEVSPMSVRMSFKPLLKPLVANATHQHSKTRSATLQAVGVGLSCVTDEYEHFMADTVLTLLNRMVADRVASTRKELAIMSRNLLLRRQRTFGRRAIEDALALTNASCQNNSLKNSGGDDSHVWGLSNGGTVSTRTGELHKDSVSADLHLVVLLLLLHGDESPDVTAAAVEGLQAVSEAWHAASATSSSSTNVHAPQGMDIDIEDAEYELQKRSPEKSATHTDFLETVDQSLESREACVSVFLEAYLYPLMRIITAGVGEWTTDSRWRHLKGLRVLLTLSGSGVALGSLLPPLLSCLSAPIRDEDTAVRLAAESCCEKLGVRVSQEEILDLLIPRVRGEVPGGDTFSQRTSAIRLLTHVILGFPLKGQEMTIGMNSASACYKHADNVFQLLSDLKMFEFREAAMRESVLLLVRAVIQVYVRPAMLSNSTYAKNILGKLSRNVMECRLDVSGGCAVVMSDESDVTMTETTTAAVGALVAGGRGGDVMILDGGEGSQQESISALSVGGTRDGCTDSTEHREGLTSHVVMSLVFLQARCPGEADIVPEAAARELDGLTESLFTHAGTSTERERGSAVRSAGDLIGLYFESILGAIQQRPTLTSENNGKNTAPRSKNSSSSSSRNNSSINGAVSGLSGPHSSTPGLVSGPLPTPAPAPAPVPVFPPVEWLPSDPKKAAFEVLVRCCPFGAWKYHQQVLDILIPQLQPKKAVEAGSMESNMLSYASVRGEEDIPSTGEVDVRLAMLALLEGLIRFGSSEWQCGEHITKAADRLLSTAIIPNLVWRVGRVEATIRKVALAACYGLLKAGAVEMKALVASAPQLVPLLVSNLDDFDESGRTMACLCLTIAFERLRGSFGEQAVHELYPKLLKRLDDSSDGVRIVVCATLESFLQCAAKQHYSGTTLDYTLDQLFIHLDDSLPAMQEAVLTVILLAGKIDPALTVKKALVNRVSHRTTEYCDKVMYEIRGFEVLDDDK